MATQPNLDLIRLAYSTETNTVEDGTYGSHINTWHNIVNAFLHTTEALLGLSNGQILVGKNSAAVQKVYINGDASMNETGLLTISNGAVTPSKMAENGKLRTQFGMDVVTINNAGTYLVFGFDRAATLVKLRLLYYTTTTTSSNITIGKPGGAAYFVASTATAASAAQWAWQDLTLANTTIAANDVMLVTNDGAGAFANAVVHLSYYYND